MDMSKRNIGIRTRTVVFDESNRLLVQHHSTHKPDFYRLLGGGIKFREKLEDCVVREIREETGLVVKVERLIWVRDFLDEFPDHSIEFFFLASIVGGKFKPHFKGEENSEYLFMTVEDLEKVVFYPKGFIQKLKLLRDDRNWAVENPYIRWVN